MLHILGWKAPERPPATAPAVLLSAPSHQPVGTVAPSAAAPLNILYVVLEDFGVLGTSTFTSVNGSANGTAAPPKTPHLERLAARGVAFRHAYANSPICNPSRTSILVGRRPSYTRVFNNNDRQETRMPAGTPTIVDFLRAADPTASIACGGGKVFHEACDSSSRGFATIPTSQRAGANSRDDGQTNDQHKVTDAISLLRAYAANRTRFFLAIGLSATHVMRPAGLCSHRAATLAGLDATPRALNAIALPGRRGHERRPPLVTWPNYDLKASFSMDTRKSSMSQREARIAIASYHACAQHVDSQIGRVIDALDSLHLAPRTAVIVHSDHGFSLGGHGRWSKYSLYEEVVRVPLVIVAPGMRRNDAVDEIVEGVDVAPTLLDLWGVRRGGDRDDGAEPPRPTYMLDERVVHFDGLSLRPLLLDGGAHAGAVIPTWPKWYARSELHEAFRLNDLTRPLAGSSEPADDGKTWPGAQLWVRTRRFAYTAYLEQVHTTNQSSEGQHGLIGAYRLIDETMYDTGGADPLEANNLAYDVRHASQRTRLLELCLRDWGVKLVGPRDATRKVRAAALKAKVKA